MNSRRKRCSACGKPFASRTGLDRHLAAHMLAPKAELSVVEAESQIRVLERQNMIRVESTLDDIPMVILDPEHWQPDLANWSGPAELLEAVAGYYDARYAISKRDAESGA